MAVKEVFKPDSATFELAPFQDRVLELVRLFHQAPVVRLRVVGTIAAGEPIEALEGADDVEIHAPMPTPYYHRLLPRLRAHLCPYLESMSGDAFEIARVITPLVIGLKLTGKLDIDLNPWLFAGIALMIERAGIAGFCAEQEPDADAAEPPPATPTRPHRTRKGGARRQGSARH